jgi:hypothetical protein
MNFKKNRLLFSAQPITYFFVIDVIDKPIISRKYLAHFFDAEEPLKYETCYDDITTKELHRSHRTRCI